MAWGCAQDEKGLSHSPGDGYYEIREPNAIYVVGSLESADKIRAGESLDRVVSSFSAKGQPLIFEANDRGLEYRLKAEYDRRHGLSR